MKIGLAGFEISTNFVYIEILMVLLINVLIQESISNNKIHSLREFRGNTVDQGWAIFLVCGPF